LILDFQVLKYQWDKQRRGWKLISMCMTWWTTTMSQVTRDIQITRIMSIYTKVMWDITGHREITNLQLTENHTDPIQLIIEVSFQSRKNWAKYDNNTHVSSPSLNANRLKCYKRKKGVGRFHCLEKVWIDYNIS